MALKPSALRTTRKSGAVLACGAALLALVAALPACSDPPTWQKLLALKITEQYPDYKVTTTTSGGLLIERPGKSTLPVDANAIGSFCRRGPKDCNYVTDQMLLELGGK